MNKQSNIAISVFLLLTLAVASFVVYWFYFRNKENSELSILDNFKDLFGITTNNQETDDNPESDDPETDNPETDNPETDDNQETSETSETDGSDDNQETSETDGSDDDITDGSYNSLSNPIQMDVTNTQSNNEGTINSIERTHTMYAKLYDIQGNLVYNWNKGTANFISEGVETKFPLSVEKGSTLWYKCSNGKRGKDQGKVNLADQNQDIILSCKDKKASITSSGNPIFES